MSPDITVRDKNWRDMAKTNFTLVWALIMKSWWQTVTEHSRHGHLRPRRAHRPLKVRWSLAVVDLKCRKRRVRGFQNNKLFNSMVLVTIIVTERTLSLSLCLSHSHTHALSQR